MIPGEVMTAEGEIELNAGRPAITLTVSNTGDRPVQVGSHYHFAETNARSISTGRRRGATGWISRRGRRCGSSRGRRGRCSWCPSAARARSGASTSRSWASYEGLHSVRCGLGGSGADASRDRGAGGHLAPRTRRGGGVEHAFRRGLARVREKPDAFAEAMVGATQAAMRGQGTAQVVSAAIGPLTERARDNRERLEGRGRRRWRD
jgi:hypothetical protein